MESKLTQSLSGRRYLILTEQLNVRYGHFSGVNRKVQLKWVTNKPPNKTPLKRIEQIIEEEIEEQPRKGEAFFGTELLACNE